ncbi:MAG: DUF1501 domain-containing protein [Myxococcales bacterium]|nr:DUF1501 domain-containing protein [Myxococcales bacterium]
MSTLSRRALVRLGLAAGGLFLPRRGLAAGTNERKFLFLFCPGGWDVCDVFAPVFNEAIDHQPGDEAADVGAFRITDGAARPSVRDFFTTWGGRTCLINGLQVPSVAHDVCTRWTMTGDANDAADDWASIIAGNTSCDRILPNVHLSGPIFPRRYISASVRVGLASQLAKLVDASALQRSDVPLTLLTPERDVVEEAFVSARLDRWARGQAAGQPTRVAAAERLALDRAAQLKYVADDIAVSNADLYSVASVAVRALSSGLARTGILAYGQGGNGLWDTHSGNSLQEGLFEELFTTLNRVLADLDTLPGEWAPTLLEETTVVVLSEMGRTPKRNAAGGKDHWTWTSAMLIGSGIAGGQTIGAWNEDLTGVPLAGKTILPGHIGATLLALADVDPGEFVDPGLGTPLLDALG